mgnify:CR=1 FL=1
MISILKNLGIKHIIEDSSGNAASAIAAYAAAANMKCTAYVPENIAEGKLKQIETFGAQIRLVIGNRDTAAKTAQKEATKSKTYYASHVYNPLFFEGIKSLAYEIYHQLNDHVPEYIFLPVGNGTMLLGLYYGFEENWSFTKIHCRSKRKIAVLLYKCIQRKKRKGSKVGYTIADSIRVEKPMRLKEMLMAITRSNGEVLTVDDEEIIEAQHQVGRKGIYIEPTAAASVAGALKYFKKGKPDNYRVIIPITGAGINTSSNKD